MAQRDCPPGKQGRKPVHPSRQVRTGGIYTAAGCLYSVSMVKQIFSIDDARKMARGKLPRLAFDYIDGAAGNEDLNHLNASAIDQIRLQPRVLVKVEDRVLKKNLLDREWGLPFGIAPMGLAGLAWPEADRMLAQAARKYDIPVGVSTMGSCSMEEMKRYAGGNGWFQLYVGPDEEMTMALVDRAEKCGYETMLLTADVPEVAKRNREQRNGFEAPFRIGVKQFVDFATHPHWSLSTLVRGKPQLVNVRARDSASGFRRSDSRAWVDWTFLDKLRSRWKGNLVVKGITSVQDALSVQQAGADGIYVSNHGGRQLNSAPATIEVLPGIRQAVGEDYPILFDSGIRNGEAVVKVLAKGADYAMLGRPFLYGIGARREVGLERIVEILLQEIRSTLAQIGRVSMEEIDTGVLAGTD